MAQFARPISDISVGRWTTAPLWSKLDEVSPSDADFVSFKPEYKSPTSDVSVGDWTTAPLFSKIDESAPSDADFISFAATGGLGEADKVCDLGIVAFTAAPAEVSSGFGPFAFMGARGRTDGGFGIMGFQCALFTNGTQAWGATVNFQTTSFVTAYSYGLGNPGGVAARLHLTESGQFASAGSGDISWLKLCAFGAGCSFEVRLTSLSTPHSQSATHTASIRLRLLNTTSTVFAQVYLMQGSANLYTLFSWIEGFTDPIPGSFTTFSVSFPGTVISDYTDLRFRFVFAPQFDDFASLESENIEVQISWCELAIPDAASPPAGTENIIQLSFAELAQPSFSHIEETERKRTDRGRRAEPLGDTPKRLGERIVQPRRRIFDDPLKL